MKDLLKFAENIYSFNSEGKQYYSAIYLDSEHKLQKKFLDENLNFVKRTSKLVDDELNNDKIKLTKKEVKELKKNLKILNPEIDEKSVFSTEKSYLKNSSSKINKKEYNNVEEALKNPNLIFIYEYGEVYANGDQSWDVDYHFYYNKEKDLYIRHEKDDYYHTDTITTISENELIKEIQSDNDSDEKTTKEFIENMKSNNDTYENNNSKKTIPFNSSKLDVPEQNMILEEHGIRENQIYRFKTYNKKHDENGKDFIEESTAYYQVKKDKEGRLRLFSYKGNQDYKDDTNSFQEANASFLNSCQAIAILDPSFTEHCLGAKYKQTHPNENIDWKKINARTEFTDITEEVQKKEKLENKKILQVYKDHDNHSEQKDYRIENVIIKEIPDEIKKYYEEGFKDKNGNKKPREITPEIYTEKMFKMLSNLYEIPDEDRNINTSNNIHKKTISPFMKAFDNTDGTENEMKKAFNRILHDKINDQDFMTKLGNLYFLTHQQDYKGLRIKRKKTTETNRDTILEAIEKDTYPFMKNKKNIDYMYNPATNGIYRGNNQMMLQIANDRNNLKAQAWAHMDFLIRNSVDSLKKTRVKAEFVALGPDKNGNPTYAMVVPVKPNRWEVAHAKRMTKYAENTVKNLIKQEKEIAKEEYRRNLFDAKYLKKNGTLPICNTTMPLIPENQPPISTNIKNPYDYPTKDSTIEERIKHDSAQYHRCMLTKEPYIPATDWTDKEFKKQLKSFVKNNPEKFERIINETYENVAVQTRSNVNENTRNNEHKDELTNEIKKTNKRSRS